ncbi:MAG: helix-turn-helix domain-containing protein [Floccifex sp.]
MLHENLARIRKEKGWTQEDLAKQMHVVRQTISKWEKGKVVPDALTVQTLAEVLDVSVSTLYGENQKEKPKKLWKIANVIKLS